MNYKRHFTPTNNKLGRCGATGKVIFRTEGAAKKRVKEILTEESNRCNDYLRAFICPRCGYWHLTSKPNEYLQQPYKTYENTTQRNPTQEHHLQWSVS